MAVEDISFSSSNINIISKNNNEVEITADDVELSDVLDAYSISDIVDHYGTGDLLDEITKEAAIEHFNIVEEK